MVFQNGISPKIGKVAHELLYVDSTKYTIKCGIVHVGNNFLVWKYCHSGNFCVEKYLC